MFGGTYFPPEPKYGRPSWNQILISVHRAFNDRNVQILNTVNNLEKISKINQSKIKILKQN
ncbi:MAG: DUF255 domain-containing protein [Saprospiraceae bacterium]|nr:DUF255 domain-containing protein [Saprospiraceae bacterium]